MTTSSQTQKGLPQSETTGRFVRHATLRQLQLLEAIVRLGSFTRAAEEMFLTQPTVSMQIKKLTDTVGTPLFLHVGRNVEPTDAGREVYAACRTILRSLTDLEIKLADLKGLKSGHFRLGVITTAKYFAPEILGAFCERFPGIDVSLKVTNRTRIIERMAANDDDLYIFGEPAHAGRCKTSLVFAVPNTAGSLYQALGEFATRQVNLTKLESRPRRNRPWQYVFYVDLDGHWQDANTSAAIVGLLSRAAFVKLLGSYPAATPLEQETSGSQSALLQI